MNSIGWVDDCPDLLVGLESSAAMQSSQNVRGMTTMWYKARYASASLCVARSGRATKCRLGQNASVRHCRLACAQKIKSRRHGVGAEQGSFNDPPKRLLDEERFYWQALPTNTDTLLDAVQTMHTVSRRHLTVAAHTGTAARVRNKPKIEWICVHQSFFFVACMTTLSCMHFAILQAATSALHADPQCNTQFCLPSAATSPGIFALVKRT